MKGFLYGCIITALLIFGINFKNGFMADLTYQKIFSASENGEIKDSIDENSVDISIARSLQGKYGEDSLSIESITPSSESYEYSVSGIIGVKKLDGSNLRCKKVKFTSGKFKRSCIVIFRVPSGTITSIEEDSKPIEIKAPQSSGNALPANSTNHSPSISVGVSTNLPNPNPNNQDIGGCNNDYDNHSDV